ncbi:putative metabolite transport protein NicT [compost metagenome]
MLGWFWLVDKPVNARWLNAAEKQLLAMALAQGRPADTANASLAQVLRNPRVYLAGLVFFCLYSGSNTVSYWMPTLIRGFGVEDLKHIGLLASIPYMGALAGMYLLARSSDKHLERRWHLGLTMVLSASCFFLLGLVQGHLLLSVGLMSIGAAAAMSSLSLFWSIPPALLSPSAAPIGIAVISCIGGLAGVISQVVVGAIKSATGDLYLAFDVIGIVLLVGVLVLLLGIPARLLSERRDVDGL